MTARVPMGDLPYNPYAPPTAEPDPARTPSGAHALATRGKRLAGAFVDGLFATVLGLAPAVALHAAGSDPFPSKVAAGTPMGWMPSGLLISLAGLIPAAIQWWLITQSGQSLGKKALKMRIVTLDGEVVGFTRGVLLRYMPIQLLGLVTTLMQAYVPSLAAVATILELLPGIDLLFIFGPSKRCLHDDIAGTQVISEDPARIAKAG